MDTTTQLTENSLRTKQAIHIEELKEIVRKPYQRIDFSNLRKTATKLHLVTRALRHDDSEFTELESDESDEWQVMYEDPLPEEIVRIQHVLLTPSIADFNKKSDIIFFILTSVNIYGDHFDSLTDFMEPSVEWWTTVNSEEATERSAALDRSAAIDRSEGKREYDEGLRHLFYGCVMKDPDFLRVLVHDDGEKRIPTHSKTPFQDVKFYTTKSYNVHPLDIADDDVQMFDCRNVRAIRHFKKAIEHGCALAILALGFIESCRSKSYELQDSDREEISLRTSKLLERAADFGFRGTDILRILFGVQK